ncbi:hypothetical protein [Chryseobacterium tongliaoense]|uniref:hypothetical protein n=1 Tax=Chryseobacterium tongliaoense TaxID=3240933 RepID=UPI0035191A0A
MRIIVAFSLVISNLFSAQIKVPDDYKKIPDILDSADFSYPFMIPDKKYDYWQVHRPSDKPEPELIYDSQRPENMAGIDESSPNNGFFRECQTENCFSYILICNNNKPESLTSEKQLKNFIGFVDNLPEALLIAKINGFSIDTANRFTGSYKIEDRYISLYALKSKSCPVIKESFLVKINRKNGKLESRSNGVYYKSNDCNK